MELKPFVIQGDYAMAVYLAYDRTHAWTLFLDDYAHDLSGTGRELGYPWYGCTPDDMQECDLEAGMITNYME